MGKGPKCETNPLPRGFNVARLLSRAVALKNMFCAFCVFPVGLALRHTDRRSLPRGMPHFMPHAARHLQDAAMPHASRHHRSK